MQRKKRIIVVGGGFGGVQAALDLDRRLRFGSNTEIVLISDRPHLEYHALLYRIMSGHKPAEVCIPLADIFEGKKVTLICDKVQTVHNKSRLIKTKNGIIYEYDYLILALGSEPCYFNTPGLKEHSFNINSIEQAIRLRKHLDSVFEEYLKSKKKENLHFIVVGGGPSGCEVAGELIWYMYGLEEEQEVSGKDIRIDLIHAGDRLLPMLPEDISRKVQEELEKRGVHVTLNQRVLKEEVETVYLNHMKMKTKTVIWTAGVSPNHLYNEIKGLTFDHRGKVVVNEYLEAVGAENMFVIGDGASTKYSGMAQTAIHDGHYVAEVITRLIRHGHIEPYKPKRPASIIPITQQWAAVDLYRLHIFGVWGAIIKRIRDFLYYASILSPLKALRAYDEDSKLSEECLLCKSIEARS